LAKLAKCVREVIRVDFVQIAHFEQLDHVRFLVMVE
jgi:hypothetical protein